jgi:DnaJ family protein C protein 10
MWKLFFVVCALLLHVALCDDFYELLGVTKAATQKEIRQAFKKLALVMHPDKNQVIF